MSNFAVAIGISIICLIISHQIVALGIGTVMSFLLQGRNIAWADRHIFKRLVHVISPVHHNKKKTNYLSSFLL